MNRREYKYHVVKDGIEYLALDSAGRICWRRSPHHVDVIRFARPIDAQRMGRFAIEYSRASENVRAVEIRVQETSCFGGIE